MFDQALFEQQLTTSWLGHSFTFFEELPSTNSYAKKVASASSLHGALVLADHQTGGRGQSERKWIVQPKQNLTFSLVFEPQKAERFIVLTLSCALAISEVINARTKLQAKLKWPNDILFNGKKLCGILTETQFSGNHLERMIVGIGLNINQTDFTDGLENTATSLAKETGVTYEREKLLAEILQKIEYRYRHWSQFSPELIQAINQTLIGYGQWTHLKVNDQLLEGEYKFLGVNETGELVALNQEFEVQKFAFEQVRVHP